MAIDLGKATAEEFELQGLASAVGRIQMSLKKAEEQRAEAINIIGTIIEKHPELKDEFPQYFQDPQQGQVDPRDLLTPTSEQLEELDNQGVGNALLDRESNVVKIADKEVQPETPADARRQEKEAKK